MISQHWLRQRFSAINQHVITWASVDPDRCRHMALFDHNELSDISSLSHKFRLNLWRAKSEFKLRQNSTPSQTPCGWIHAVPCTLKTSVKWTPLLTHWGRDKKAAISQTTLWNAFSWMKILEFRLRFQWSLFLRVQLTIIQHWFR